MPDASLNDRHMTPLFINGRWERGEASEAVPVMNPATGEALYELSLANPRQLDRAVESAGAAFLKWRDVEAVQRARILHQAANLLRERRENIARSITREQGKPLREALGEVANASDVFDWYAEESRRSYGRIIPSRKPGLESIVDLEPLGVVAAFTPWNVPCLASAKKIGAALAAGCTLVIKPPEETPSAAIEIARALAESGLPDGVLNVVFGVPHVVSEHLIDRPEVQKVSLTGSQRAGREIARLCARHTKRSSLELGGSAPVIICEDADPEAAAALLLPAKFANAGQLCISPTRFFVHESVYEGFLDFVAGRVSVMRLGDGMDPDTAMGPLANTRRVAAVEALVEDAVSTGAKIRARSDRNPNAGNFHPAILLSDVGDEARIMREEPFGPVIPVQPFTNLDSAVEKANGLDFGLAGYAFSSSHSTLRRLRRDIEVGVLGLNTCDISGPETPFVGIKGSGYGFKGGLEGLREYYNVKYVAEAF